MKRILLTIILSLTAVAAANAQYFDLSLNKGRYEVGINLSQVATNTQYSRLTLGGSLMAWGVYMGITTALPQHRYDNTVSDTKWNDDKVFLIHAGYHFGGGISVQPLKWFSINLIYTRYSIQGGIGISIQSFAHE